MRTTSLKPQLIRSLAWAFLFQLAWFGAALILMSLGAPIRLWLVIILMPLLWVPVAVEAISRTEVPIALQIQYYLFVTASSVAGSAFTVYGIIPHWDSVVHGFSGVLLAWLGMFTVQRIETQFDVRIPRWFVVAAALVTPMAFAAVWEIGEFSSDFFFHTTTQAGLTDTITDMASAGVGAVITVVVAVWFGWPRVFMTRALHKNA